jgi:lipoate-protein ligase A
MKDAETWRLLDLEYRDPYMNLALEEAIPYNVGGGASPNTVRFWRNSNAVVIGHFQSAKREVNQDGCNKHQTTVVRRFTGGGAVYHDLGNLNCSISIQRDHPFIESDVGETFAKLLQGVMEGLKLLGAPVRFEPPNSIQVNGQKISGGAGALKSGFVFHHCSILVSSDLERLSEVLSSSESSVEESYVRSVRKDVSTLSMQLGRELAIAEVKDSLKRGFEKAFIIRIAEGETTVEERALAEKLYSEKYSKEAWNFDP